MANIVSSLLDPVTLFMAVIVVGGAVCMLKRKLGAFIIVLAFLQLWIFSLPSITGLMAHYMERDVNQYSVEPDAYELGNKSIDFIVIMGGSNSEYPRSSKIDNLGGETLKRFMEGLAIAKKVATTRIIVSGRANHAAYVKETLMEWGIAEERIIVNHHVQNTQAEIASIAKILADNNEKSSSLMIVSSAIHIPRIKIWARYYGLFPLYSGTGYQGFISQNYSGVYDSLSILIPNASASYQSKSVLHELVGMLYANIWILSNKYL